MANVRTASDLLILDLPVTVASVLDSTSLFKIRILNSTSFDILPTQCKFYMTLVETKGP